jgi:hypothetical protein
LREDNKVKDTKSKLVSDVKQQSELGSKHMKHGYELLGRFVKVRDLINSIDVSLDISDQQVVMRLAESYGETTTEAMNEQVQEQVCDTNKNLEGISDSATEEKSKVDDALQKTQDMSGATDVGKEGAEKAGESFKESGEFYQGQIDGIKSQIGKFSEESEKLMSDTRDLF